MRKKVVIVDDDEMQRRGMAEYLADRPEVEVVGVLTHGEALQWTAEWDAVDVALVDAADPDNVEDNFPGVAVVDLIRRRRSSAQTTVIVVTGHFFDGAIRRRMREAGADFLYHRLDLRKKEQLYAAVLSPDQARQGMPESTDPDSEYRLGITSTTRVNSAVRYSTQTGLAPLKGATDGRRSRTWNNYRRSFNRTARLNTVNADGTMPDRDQTDPSLSQIERFLKWATQIKP
jgi:DNA-binding NarL/FixJ family response regulator